MDEPNTDTGVIWLFIEAGGPYTPWPAAFLSDCDWGWILNVDVETDVSTFGGLVVLIGGLVPAGPGMALVKSHDVATGGVCVSSVAPARGGVGMGGIGNAASGGYVGLGVPWDRSRALGLSESAVTDQGVGLFKRVPPAAKLGLASRSFAAGGIALASHVVPFGEVGLTGWDGPLPSFTPGAVGFVSSAPRHDTFALAGILPATQEMSLESWRGPFPERTPGEVGIAAAVAGGTVGLRGGVTATQAVGIVGGVSQPSSSVALAATSASDGGMGLTAMRPVPERTVGEIGLPGETPAAASVGIVGEVAAGEIGFDGVSLPDLHHAVAIAQDSDSAAAAGQVVIDERTLPNGQVAFQSSVLAGPLASADSGGAVVNSITLHDVTVFDGMLVIVLGKYSGPPNDGLPTVTFQGSPLTLGRESRILQASFGGPSIGDLFILYAPVSAGVGDVVVTLDGTETGAMFVQVVGVVGVSVNFMASQANGLVSAPTYSAVGVNTTFPLVGIAAFLMVNPGGAWTWDAPYVSGGLDLTQTVGGDVVSLTMAISYPPPTFPDRSVSLSGVTPDIWDMVFVWLK